MYETLYRLRNILVNIDEFIFYYLSEVYVLYKFNNYEHEHVKIKQMSDTEYIFAMILCNISFLICFRLSSY